MSQHVIVGDPRRPPQYKGGASFTLTMSPAANQLWEEIQKESGESPDDLLRKALGLLKLAYDARRDGKHLGTSTDSAALDTEIVL